MNRVNIPISTIELIGSHGQTIWHDVTGGQVSSTLQLGDPSVIAIYTGVTTVGNFRVAMLPLADKERHAYQPLKIDKFLVRVPQAIPIQSLLQKLTRDNPVIHDKIFAAGTTVGQKHGNREQSQQELCGRN